MRTAILLFGPTGAGKTTLGKLLEQRTLAKYLSFGDLKRTEIALATPLGQRLQSQIEQRKPISSKDGIELLRPHVADGLNVICGFPISSDEFESFCSLCSVVGVISFTLSPEEIERRFFGRRICSVCLMPGQDGDTCPLHGKVMVARSDVTVVEYRARLLLYQERIVPFLASKCLHHLPNLLLNSEVLSPDAQCKRVFEWITHHVHGGA
jgi:adenylate kinase family enzyme